MPKFHLVEIPDAPLNSRWTIEQVVPGEKPVPIPFFGKRAAAEAEVNRLNSGGAIHEKRLMAAKVPKRPHNANQLAKMIVDLATGEASEETPAPLTPAQEFARSGGLKSGAARREALSPERHRAEIAKKAAAKWWGKG